MTGAWLLFAFLDGLPGLLSFILIPLSIVSLLIAAVALTIVVCVLVSLRRLRKAASFALALIVPFILRAPINRAADCMHLALTLKFGVGVLTDGSAKTGALVDPVPMSEMDDEPFAAFDWSVGLAGGTNIFLIRDLTDEVALPLYQHKDITSDKTGFAEECSGKSEHLLGHYYICNID